MRVREIIRDRKKAAQIIHLDIEVVERYIQAYQCPFCKDGHIYKMLPLHIYQMHGITAYEFRKEYGMNRGHRLASIETSELMSQSIKRRGGPNKSWLDYDRHITTLNRYKDGGQRDETIRNKSVIANTPETKARFNKVMSKIDRKTIAMRMDPAIVKARGEKGAKALIEKIGIEKLKEYLSKARTFLPNLPEEVKRKRIFDAQKTMKAKYWSDPNWVSKWHKNTKEAIQSRARIPRIEYPQIVELYESGISQTTIGKQYGVSPSLIHVIIKSEKLGLDTLIRRSLCISTKF